jgi:Heterokaryon incompatibility protein (HET)
VRQNGLSALKHLRQKLGSFSIWIDAVCINQSPKDSAAEKKQQIPLMGEIYSGAQIIYIWLGEGTEQSDRAMAHLGKAGFLDYFSTTGSSRSRVWTAVWSLQRTIRCSRNYQLLCTSQSHLTLELSLLLC